MSAYIGPMHGAGDKENGDSIVIRAETVPRAVLEVRRPLPCKRIELKNFRCIESLTLDLPAGTSERAGWLVLLGENAVGKSSVLQAVALALAEERLSEIDYWQLLFRKARPKRGFVHLDLSIEAPGVPPAQAWAEMALEPSGPSFKASEGIFPDPSGDGYVLGLGYVFGFGAARWLPREGWKRSSPGWQDWRVRIANLFNPFVPLQDGIYWLEGLPEEDFRRAATPLLRLLGRPSTDRLKRRKGEVVLDGSGRSGFQPIREFSDGYQTILAIACEILQVTRETYKDPATAQGIVLLDEIESHLHPRWKMKIVEGFRAAFPRMQFIVTTHDPLCLRGLEKGEVVVMRRDSKGRVLAITDLPSVAGLRADQLLTSEFFGLSSTIDPIYEKLFSEYYELRRRKKLTTDEEKRVAELRTALEKLGMMGATRREQLMLEAIDGYLARERQSPETRASGKRELSHTLAGILASLDEV